MNVSRSGYYKWLKHKDELNQYEIDRIQLEELIKDIHRRKPSYGYRRINSKILTETGWIVSDNLVHKVCKALKIYSKAKHYGRYRKPGEESIKYPNLIKGNWNANRPFALNRIRLLSSLRQKVLLMLRKLRQLHVLLLLKMMLKL